MSFLDRIAACAVFDPSAYLPFRACGLTVGRVRPGTADRLRQFPEVFRVSDEALDLAPELADCEARTAAVDRVVRQLAAQGVVAGWREEPYPVGTSYGGPVLFTMERAAVPLFGVCAYGVHVNGYVRYGDRIDMWIARRSPDKPTAPGKLDQMVAGGQPAGITLARNLIKESAEEAGVPPGLAARARPVGAITYRTERREGLRDDVLFNYDLELATDFRPANRDGEIAEFLLWPIERVREIVRDTDDFKFNCALVVIDFLVRHGYIAPDHPDYVDILKGLHG